MVDPPENGWECSASIVDAGDRLDILCLVLERRSVKSVCHSHRPGAKAGCDQRTRLGKVDHTMNAIIGIAFCVLLVVSIKASGVGALLWFPVGFVVALFVAAQILLPITLGLPRAIRLVSRREMRAAIFGRLLLTPLVWFILLFVLLFLIGFFWPSAADFLYNNTALNFGASVGTIAIVFSPLSAKSRADFKTDFDKSYQRFYTLPYTAPQPTAAALRTGLPDGEKALELNRSGTEGKAYAQGQSSLKDYQKIVFTFSDLLAEHIPPLGDCSKLPHPKKTVLYAICWVKDYYEKLLEQADEKERGESHHKIVDTLNFLLTRLTTDWQDIDPEDKDAVGRLANCNSFPDWALPLKAKYINEEKASKEACEAAFQVMRDGVHR
jgi:hypothetical protein